MPVKRPINKKSPPDQILLRYRAPVAAVVAVVAVVAHREITMLRHDKRTIRLRQIIAAQSISPVGKLRCHNAREAKTLSFFSIDIEKWRADLQGVTRQAGQALYIKRRACFRIFTNPQYVVCAKNKHVATMRFDEIITDFIDEDLIARVHIAARNYFTAPADPPRKNVKIMAERFWRRVNQKMLTLASEPGECKKKEKFSLIELYDLVILLRDNVDIIAPEDDELADLPQKIRRRCHRRMTDDSIQGRLHRASRNLERLQEI